MINFKRYFFAAAILSVTAFGMNDSQAKDDGFVISGKYQDGHTIINFDNSTHKNLRFGNTVTVSTTSQDFSVGNLDPHMQRLIYSFRPMPKEETIVSFEKLQTLSNLTISGSGSIVIDDTEFWCLFENSKLIKAEIVKGKMRNEDQIYEKGAKYVNGSWSQSNN